LGAPAAAGAAATATYTPASGTLTVIGDALDNALTVSRDAAGVIQINGGAVAIVGGTPTVANTTLIQVFGLDGNDVLTMDEANGALPRAYLFGGAGDDSLTGGAADNQLFGQTGNDTLSGKGGIDYLFGGAGDDTLTGGAGDDQVFGESGNDRLVWNPGDGTDLDEGGADTDTVELNGGNEAETFTATANGARVRLDRLSPAPFDLDIGTAEHLVLNANGGGDAFSATGNLAALIQITVDGGPGNDTLLGSNGADTLTGGSGNDTVDGQQGNDVVDLGDGADVFQWDPGDGSDVVEGQAGADTLRFNGSSGAEIFDVAASGGRVRFARNLGNVVLDLGTFERLEVNALGNADTIVVHDLTDTGVQVVSPNLAGTIGGPAGDGQPDTVLVNGTAAGDRIQVVESGGTAAVTGLGARVQVSGSEAAHDQLIVNTLDGDDVLIATAPPAGLIKVTVDGGPGNDTLRGASGSAVTLGGDGTDTVEVNGTDEAETYTATANGARVRLDRLSPAPFDLDIDTTEHLVLNTRGGDDAFSATGNLGALIQLAVSGGAGNDTLRGSNGADTLNGGDGDDVLDGQQGNDRLLGGPGADAFQWDPGDGSDVVEGQAGSDVLRFNGSSGAEIFDVAASGGRVRFARNLGNVVLDLDGVERLEVNALGNADTVVVHDLGPTDAEAVAVDLAGTLGGSTGDGQRDEVVVDGSGRGDTVTVAPSEGAVAVTGLAARVEVRHAEGALDVLRVQGQAGNDAVTAQTLPAGLINLTLDGGPGRDQLTGSDGDDALQGGDGDDVLDGGPGTDTLDGGAGTDVGLNGEAVANIP
jgi:Ca2+-binding RTX toxin-like protein